MIIFSGNLSNSCTNYIINIFKNYSYFVSLIITTPFIVLTILLSFLVDWIFIIFLIPLQFLSLIFLIKPRGKMLYDIIPKQITLDKEFISCTGQNFNVKKNISYIKTIIDRGELYHIYFKFPHKDLRFVCQKDLIKTGTLQEFEEVFKDKIVRKIKK